MRFLLLFFCFFLSSCVENLIHISVFSNGTYTIKYNSIGDKKDLEDNDFIHPTDSENLYWVSSIQKKESTQFEALNTWEKETILKTPTKEKLIFSNSDNMQYYIEVEKRDYYFYSDYVFKSTIKSLEIDKKYSNINQYLKVDEDNLSWLIPSKEYIIKSSIEDYRMFSNESDIFFERLNNQLSTYIEYAKEKELEEKFNKNSSLIIEDAFRPILDILPKNFFKDLKPKIDQFEKEFEKNTALMLDSFTFSVSLPGKLYKNNSDDFLDGDNIIYWNFDFDDIAFKDFKMFAHSREVDSFKIQSLIILVILILSVAIWKQSKKK